MHPPLPEPDGLFQADAKTGDSASAASRVLFEEELRVLLDFEIAAISWGKMRKRELPRLAQFASVLEEGAFQPRERGVAAPTVVGTTLRPDDDVIQMDATIPRPPVEELEED